MIHIPEYGELNPSLHALPDLNHWVQARHVFDLFSHSANRFGDRIAFSHLSGDGLSTPPELQTYSALLKQITRAANALRTHGAAPGRAVGLLLPSLPATHWLLWGAETAATALPLNALLSAEHIAALLRAADASVLVALGPQPGSGPGSDIWSKAVAAQEMLGDQLACLIQVGGEAQRTAGVVQFTELMSSAPDVLGFDPDPHAVAACFHTGGTTGAPKLVQHSHSNQIASAFAFAYAAELRPGDVLTNGFPLFHVAGALCCSLAPFMAGAQVLNLSPAGFRNPHMVSNFWRIIERHRVTVAGGVPTALGAICEVPPEDADLSSLRCAYSGGSLLPQSVARRFEAACGQRMHEVYGMTETAGVIAVEPVRGERVIGSAGITAAFMQSDIRALRADGTTGPSCPPGTPGVLVVRGPTVTPGYREPRHNEGAFTADGWLITGDLAVMSADGRITVTGRSKDLIIRSGHNIDPTQIEEAAMQHRGVAAAAAVGMPDRYAGELPALYVVAAPGQTLNLADLQRHLEQTVGERPAVPKRIEVVQALPMTAVGKVYKPALRSAATQRVVQEALADLATELGCALDLQINVVDTASAGSCVQVQWHQGVSPGHPIHPDRLHAALASRLSGFWFAWRLDPRLEAIESTPASAPAPS